MKIKLGKRAFTFLIIPDANSKVRRFRFSAVLLYSLIISFAIAGVSFLTITIYMNMTGMKNLHDKNIIAAELAVKTVTYERKLTSKEETIEDLQNSLVELAEQTAVMKLKVEELQTFEEEIRSIASAASGKADERDVAISSYSSEDELYLTGIGGDSNEASDEEITSLVVDTKQTLYKLIDDAGDLLQQLSNTKESIIQHNQLMRITPSMWPTVSTRVTSSYGYRKDPFSRKASFHAGYDIAGYTSDPVYSTADGVITSSGYHRGYGNNITVKHANGLSTHYSHLKKILVKTGQTVEQGETIGLLGSTGRSTGPHLHYEVLKNGKAIDPTPYLQAAGKDVKLNVQEEDNKD